jgi:hypothetical protein
LKINKLNTMETSLPLGTASHASWRKLQIQAVAVSRKALRVGTTNYICFMKRKVRTILFAAAAATAAGATVMMMSACGATKGGWDTNNPCQELQEEKPAIRAVGKGTHFKEMTARNIAETQARAEFARKIAPKITTATREEAAAIEKYSGNSGTGDSENDQNSASNDLSQSIAEAVVANTTTIKTIHKQLPNKQFEYWVCIEYQKGISDMAAEIAKKVMQRIPDEEQAKIRENHKNFRDDIEKELNK